MFGTGIIQGFALTLGIGVMVSMFSAIVLTRVFLYIAAGPRMSQLKWLFLGNKK
jgi:preprotein translocase subunit SecD